VASLWMNEHPVHLSGTFPNIPITLKVMSHDHAYGSKDSAYDV